MSKKSEKSKQHFRTSLVVCAIILALFVIDLTPLGGNLKFYASWIGCGRRPVATNPTWRLAGDPQYYADAPMFGVLRGGTKYFCTPLQAEEAGYSASPDTYVFPELEKQKQRT